MPIDYKIFASFNEEEHELLFIEFRHKFFYQKINRRPRFDYNQNWNF